MRSLATAICFAWWQLLIAIVISALLSLGACRLHMLLDSNQVAVLFGIKVGIVAVVTSATLFFFRFFWDDIEKMKLEEYPKIISYYTNSFVLLFVINILILISAGLDGYIVLFRDIPTVQYVSHGCFLTAILFLIVFVFLFYTRVFAELQTLRRAGTRKRDSTP